MVSRALRRRREMSREILAMLMAATIILGALQAAPAEWFLRVHSIQVVQSEAGKAIVIQTRTVWPGDALKVRWSAEVDQIVLDENHRATGATVCKGSGVATIRDDVFIVVKMPLADWVGDPRCEPKVGEPHVVDASWSFEILGFTKTASARSAAFTLVDKTIRLDR